MKFLIRLVITAAALWAAVQLVRGISHTGHWTELLAVALVFGGINAIVRPILVTLTCPLIMLTLGLFVLVLNALMLWMTSAFAGALGIAFHVDGFMAALVGGIVVGVVSALLNLFVSD